MGNAKRRLGHFACLLTIVGCLVPAGAAAQDTGSVVPKVLAAKDPKLVYRLDLMTDRFEPMAQNDLRVGYIYYHFCPRRNAWVWSYLQKDGSFWHAFGEGTTQVARTFDIRASREEIAKRLAEFPDLAKRVDQYNQAVCLRLRADGRWEVIGVGSAPSIFDAETGERWQKFSKDEYIPVVHTGGTSWTIRDGTYYPSGSFSSRR